MAKAKKTTHKVDHSIPMYKVTKGRYGETHAHLTPKGRQEDAFHKSLKGATKIVEDERTGEVKEVKLSDFERGCNAGKHSEIRRNRMFFGRLRAKREERRNRKK